MSYHPISKSTYVGCSIQKYKIEQEGHCFCHRNRKQYHYCRENCDNKKSKIECDATNCLCQNFCKNKPFSHPPKRSFEIIKTVNKGQGLITLGPVMKDQFVIEYVGEVYDTRTEYGRKKYDENIKNQVLYMMELKKGLVVDAKRQGNLSRFINHSCEPNCQVEIWIVKGYLRLGIFALRDICQFEELSYNYREFFWKQANFRCSCQTPSCFSNTQIQETPTNTITLSIHVTIGHLMYLRQNYNQLVGQLKTMIVWDKEYVERNLENVKEEVEIRLSGDSDDVINERNIFVRLLKIQIDEYLVWESSMQQVESFLEKYSIFNIEIESNLVCMRRVFVFGNKKILAQVQKLMEIFKGIKQKFGSFSAREGEKAQCVTECTTEIDTISTNSKK